MDVVTVTKKSKMEDNRRGRWLNDSRNRLEKFEGVSQGVCLTTKSAAHVKNGDLPLCLMRLRCSSSCCSGLHGVHTSGGCGCRGGATWVGGPRRNVNQSWELFDTSLCCMCVALTVDALVWEYGTAAKRVAVSQRCIHQRQTWSRSALQQLQLFMGSLGHWKSTMTITTRPNTATRADLKD